MSDPLSVALSVRVYRMLLNAYPPKFRAEYGEAMAQVFRDLCLRGGEMGLAGIWGRALLDYGVSLVSEHMDRGVEMTKSKWIQLSGWGLAASGFLLMAGFAASSRPTYNPDNAAAWPMDPVLNAVDMIFVVLALLLMSAGLAGLLARFQERAGALGRTGLVFGGIAGLISAAGAVGLGYVDSGPWWDVFIVGLMGVNLGLVLFGVACLHQRLFARWNGLPLFIGAVFLLLALASMGLVNIEWPGFTAFVWLLSFALGLGAVGYRLQSEAADHPLIRPV